MEYKYGRWGVLPCLQICYERRTLLHVDVSITLRSLSTAYGVILTQCAGMCTACILLVVCKYMYLLLVVHMCTYM